MRGEFIHFAGPRGDFTGASVLVKMESDDVATAIITAKNEIV
jgi:predicted aconitase with swiveling domain